MVINKEVLIERERTKKLVEALINNKIEWREENIKRRKRRNISLLESIRDDIIFWIDNPNRLPKCMRDEGEDGI